MECNPGLVDGDGAVLKRGSFAISPSPIQGSRLRAGGDETLAALGLAERLRPRFVLGENIAQTHQFVASGNAELGFVALAQVTKDGESAKARGIVPAQLHQPIRQDAVLLARARPRQCGRESLSRMAEGRRRQRRRSAASATTCPDPAMPLSDADLAAIWLTLKLATLTTALLLVAGTPLAWWLARTAARWKVP